MRIRKAGLKPTDYALLASGADSGVAAINRFALRFLSLQLSVCAGPDTILHLFHL